MFKKLQIFVALAACLLVQIPPVFADYYTDGYIDPSWQGQSNTTYQEWVNGFTTSGVNAPGYRVGGADGITDPALQAAKIAQYAPHNPNGIANAGSPVGFMTSTYGIYHFAAQVQPTVTVPNYNLGDDYNTIVRWQISIDRIGEWIDLDTVTITPEGGAPVSLTGGIDWVRKSYVDGEWIYPVVQTTTNGTGIYQDLGFFSGVAGGYGEGPDYTLGYLFEWVLPGNAASYTLNASALGTSMSFKGTQVDTWAVTSVPEPNSLLLLAMSLSGIAARRRRAATC